MLNYETLDKIADSYIPILGGISFACIIYSIYCKNWQQARNQIVSIFGNVVIVYGVMYIDRKLKIWDSIKLDYSTHTALSIVLISFLITHLNRYNILWISSLIFYMILMIYQKYHTLIEIVSTAIVIKTITFILMQKLALKK